MRSRILWLLFSLLVSTGMLPAQETSSELSKEIDEVKTRVEAISADESLDELAKESLLKDLNEGLGHLEAAEEFQARETEYREAITNGPRELIRLQAEAEALDTSREESLLPSNISESSTMAQLEEAISREQALLIDARNTLNSINVKLAEKSSTPTEIRDRLISITAELSQVDTLRGELDDTDESDAEQAKISALESRRKSLLAENTMLEQEALSYDVRVELSNAGIILAEKRIDVASERLAALQALANSRLSNELERAEALLSRASDIPAPEDSPLLTLTANLESLVEETRSVSGRLQVTTERFEEREEMLKSITADFESIKRQVELGGLEGSFASVLLERRRTLPSALKERQLLGQIRRELTEAQRSLFYLENRPKSTFSDDSSAGGGNDRIGKELLETNSRLRGDLIGNYRRLIRLLGELDFTEQRIHQLSAEFRSFLAEQLFWVRSSPLLNLDTLRGIPAAVQSAAGLARWKELGHQIASLPLRFYLVWLAFLVPLLLGRKKFSEDLEKLGDCTRRISTDKYANTLKAFWLTLFLALPVPLTIAAFGFGFRNTSGATEWSYGLGDALLNLGCVLLAASFFRELGREKGLGDYHFKWSRDSIAQVRSLFGRVLLIYIPLSLLFFVGLSESDADYLNNLGRIAALILVLGVGIPLIAFTKPRAGKEDSVPESESTFFRRQWLFLLVTIATVGLVLLLISGYVATAFLLIVEFHITLLLLFGSFVLFGMALRWFEIRERKLALAELIEERRAIREASVKEEEEDENESEEMPSGEAEEDEQIDLVEVAEQTRNVIKFLVGALLLIALWYTWTEVAPILSVLDRVEILGGLSIGDFAFSILVIAVTTSITKNLSGLLEVLILRRLDLVPGTRSAIVSLVRYGVIVVGALILFRHIGVDWSQFGWIAAALSVGLGFGLQEIVANFICGIILLFERPIRVGDVVTVGGVSGTVTRIQMRATTITNWDREELIVPNKQFITGSLINMTLTSPINRIVIPVGVAYGSDTEEVLRILSEVAEQNEEIMEDPGPIVSFEGFGESSLDFAIRIFLPDRKNRLGVTTDLHTEINRRFEEAGIEIPFPQRDLHVRSVEESVVVSTDRKASR